MRSGHSGSPPMAEVQCVDRLDRAWQDIQRCHPEITGCRVYGSRDGAAVPVPGDGGGPALQVNAPAGVGARLHHRFLDALDVRGVRPVAVAVVDLLGVASGFGSADRTTWEPPAHDLCAGARPVVSSRQSGLVLRFGCAGEAAAAWAELEGWRPAYGQAILDRSLHVVDEPAADPRAAVVSEHQLVDPDGRRLVYLSPKPPACPSDGTWVAAPSDRFEFHQYLQWASPAPATS